MEDKRTRELIKYFRKSRSAKALQVLMVNHQAAIRLAASYYPTNILETSDKIQIGNMVLLSLINPGGFDLRRKTKFVTHLIHKTKHKVIDETRKHLRKHNNETIKRVELHTGIDYGIKEEDPVEIVENNETKELLIKGIQNLPRNEQIIMACMLQGMSISDIADQSGVTVSRISQLATKAKKKLAVTLQ